MKRMAGFGLAALVLACLPLRCHAECRFQTGGTTAVAFLGLPSTINIPTNTPNGYVLASSAVTPPADPPVLTCGHWGSFFGYPVWIQQSETVTYGVVNVRGGYKSDNVTYESGIPGIGYRIKHPTDYLTPYPQNSEQLAGSTFSVSSVLEIVKTGSIQPSTLAAGKLADWRWGDLVPETFVLPNSITFTTPSCSLVANPLNVTLPPVTTGAFGGVGSTSGTTPFRIGLSCASGVSVTAIAMHTASPEGHPGVIAPSGSGYAAGVGVQVLDSQSNPVTWDAQMVLAPGATASIPFYARYYQTAAAVTGGAVKGTVTFDVFYQ